MENLNLFGAEMKFNYDGKILYKTSIGMFLSILFYILTGVFIFLTGQDFLKRTNPKTSISTAFDNDYKKHNISNMDVMFRITDINGINLNDVSIIDLRASFVQLEIKNSTVTPIGFVPIKITKCNNQIISNDLMINNNNLNAFLCFEKIDFEIGGYFDGSFLNFINLEVIKCANRPHCKSIDEIDQYLAKNNFFLQFVIPETTTNPNDYHNGLESVPKSFLTSVDPLIASFNDYFLKITNIITDYGWITKEIKNQYNLGFHYENKKNYKIKEDNVIIKNMIYVNKYNVTVNREYPKIQTLLAELGGILNFFIIVFKTLSNIYASFHLRLKLIRALNQKSSEFEEQKLNKMNRNKSLNNESLSVSKNDSFSNNINNVKQNNISDNKNELHISNIYELKSSNNISLNTNDLDRKSSNIELNEMIDIKPLRHDDILKNSQSQSQNQSELKIKYEKKFMLKQSLKDLDDLKQIEDKVDIDYVEPISMFMHLTFPCCFNKEKIKQYDEIYKQYDSYFEFHNLMLLEHKLSILVQTIFNE